MKRDLLPRRPGKQYGQLCLSQRPPICHRAATLLNAGVGVSLLSAPHED